jgi:hypothetical protein
MEEGCHCVSHPATKRRRRDSWSVDGDGGTWCRVSSFETKERRKGKERSGAVQVHSIVQPFFALFLQQSVV